MKRRKDLPIPSEHHLNEDDLAARWGVSSKMLQARRAKGDGPAYFKFGTGPRAPVRYSLADIIAWENAHRREPSKVDQEPGSQTPN